MLTVNNLVKNFGDLRAVSAMSFQINDGEILGLVGPNGAGKTTTFRMLLGLMRPDEGEVLWNGAPLNDKVRDLIGYLPEERGLYPKETVEHQIVYFGSLRGKDPKELKPKVDEWLTKLKVKGKKSSKIKELSKGNQQKVQLITTLIHEPKLVILDEPFSGLDPINADIMKDAIIELRKQGACVIFSSHNMDNVEKICDRLLMIKNGQQIMTGSVDEIKESFGRTKVFLESNLTKSEIMAVPGVLDVKAQGKVFEVKLADPAVGKELFKLATKDGYIPTFSQQTLTLEEIFKLKVGELNG
ncbi:MAG: ABC transporter ATP-binding protein [Lactobacillus sp.]|nr:ABC transporter ATP-binding protein [Lactobacillus sp.]MBD5069219.1 ABC transporter ATP-binding protein [Lactobacillus sp.]